MSQIMLCTCKQAKRLRSSRIHCPVPSDDVGKRAICAGPGGYPNHTLAALERLAGCWAGLSSSLTRCAAIDN